MLPKLVCVSWLSWV